MASSSPHIRWFETIRLEDVPLVGGKNASLGELYGELGGAGVRVPNGFALTVSSYVDALSSANAFVALHALLDGLDIADVDALADRAAKARKIVYDATGGAELRSDIVAAYGQLETQYGRGVAVAVRSSATAEDLPTASFAGQQESYLNVRGSRRLCSRPAVAASPRCSPTAPSSTAWTTGSTISRSRSRSACMKMVRSDLGAQRRDVHARHRDRLPRRGVHHRRYGLGENVVQGTRRSRRVPTCTSRPSSRAIAPCCATRSGSKQLTLIYADGHTAVDDAQCSRPPRRSAPASASTTMKC